MKKHLQYLSYIIRHKWFVFIAGFKVNVSLWCSLTHDLSKLLPSEWFPYVEFFYGSTEYTYGPDGSAPHNKFNAAWLKHQHHNPHHWQRWILRGDDGGTQAIRMPERYIREMVADWAGAGRAITGKWDVGEWYEKNKDKMLLHSNTRKRVEDLLLLYGAEEMKN